MNTNKHTIPQIKFYKWSVNPVVLQFQCTWRELRTHSMSGCGQNFDLKSIDRCRKWNALKMKFLIYEIYWIFVYLAKFLFTFLMKIFLFLFFSSYPDLILWLKREKTKMQDWLHFQWRICSELSFCRIQGVGVTHMHLPCVRVQGVGVTRFQMR